MIFRAKQPKGIFLNYNHATKEVIEFTVRGMRNDEVEKIFFVLMKVVDEKSNDALKIIKEI